MNMMATDDAITGPINLGNSGEFTIRQLAETVLELTNSKSKIVEARLPQDDPQQRCPDITQARNVLGWSPEIELRSGLEKTIAYFHDLLSSGQITHAKN
jgi:UDP-glucuronate decarboxylase